MVVGSPVAGESYTLECSAGGSEGTFQWLGPPDGTTPVDDNHPNVNIVSNGTSSQLQFKPLQQSNNGSYSCNATIGGLALSSVSEEINANGTILYYISCQMLIVMSHFVYFSTLCISPD